MNGGGDGGPKGGGSASNPTFLPNLPWKLEEERELWRDICRSSFWYFCKVGWGIDHYMKENPHDQWLSEEIHKPLCDWLQRHVEEWERRRNASQKRRTKIAIIVPRGFGKTMLVTKALNLWTQVRNPNLSNFIGSEVGPKASGFLDPIKQVMKGDDPYACFAWLYGSWYDPERTWNQGEVVHGARAAVAKSEPSFATWGIKKGITGAHPDIGILDDPISEEKLTEEGTWLDTVNRGVGALRPAFRSDSLFILVCTRYRDNDVAGVSLLKEGICEWEGMHPRDKRMMEAIRDDGEWNVYFLQALNEHDESILPEVHSTFELKSYRRSLPREFAAQMMNEPGSGEHMPFPTAEIERCYVSPSDVPTNLIYTIHLDTALKDARRIGKGDETVIIVVGHDPKGSGDVYFIEGYGSNTWTPEIFLDKLSGILHRYRKEKRKILALTDEINPGDKFKGESMWKETLRSWLIGAGLERLPQIELIARSRGTSESVKIMQSFSYWWDGHVKLIKGAPGVEVLEEQVTRYGILGMDDWVRAFTDCFTPRIYRRVKNTSNKNLGDELRLPGDELLKGFTAPKSDDDYRYLYDHLAPDIKEEDWII